MLTFTSSRLHLRFALLVAGCIWMVSASAQDPEFTLFDQNPTYLNPALTGLFGAEWNGFGQDNCSRLILQHRQQWNNLAGDYATSYVSYDHILPAIKGGGIGGYVLHDVAGQGVLTTTRIAGQGSKSVRIGRRVKAALGLEFSFNQKSLDWSRLSFPDMIDPQYGFVYGTSISPNQAQGTNYTDVSAGLSCIYSLRKPGPRKEPQLHFGIAAHHIDEPNESLFEGPSRLPVKFTGYAMVNLYLQDRVSLRTGTFYRRQGEFQHILLGGTIKFESQQENGAGFGFWYRGMPSTQYSDAIIGNFTWFRPNFQLNFNWDFTYSDLRPTTAPELNMVMTIPCDTKAIQRRLEKNRIWRLLTCPSCRWARNDAKHRSRREVSALDTEQQQHK